MKGKESKESKNKEKKQGKERKETHESNLVHGTKQWVDYCWETVPQRPDAYNKKPKNGKKFGRRLDHSFS